MLRDAQTVENGAKSSDAVLMNLERFLVLLCCKLVFRRRNKYVGRLPRAHPGVNVARGAAALDLSQVCAQGARLPTRLSRGEGSDNEEHTCHLDREDRRKLFKAHRNAKEVFAKGFIRSVILIHKLDNFASLEY